MIPVLYSIHGNCHKTASDHSGLQPNWAYQKWDSWKNNCLRVHSNWISFYIDRNI